MRQVRIAFLLFILTYIQMDVIRFQMLGKKLMRKRATLQDIYRLYQAIVRVPKIINALQELECVTVTNVICDPMRDILQELVMYKEMVEKIIDTDAIRKGEFRIRASFDDELGELKATMDTFESKMEKLLTKAKHDLDFDNVKLEYVSHLGHHFRLTLKDEGNLRKNNKYRILDAVKGGVRFTNDALENLNQEYLSAQERYDEQQQTIVEEVIKVALGYLNSFTRLNNTIAELDCLLAFAVAAVSAPIPYVKPKMSTKSVRTLQLIGMRHPCLELQEDVTFIANDVEFKDNETNMFIITGPYRVLPFFKWFYDRLKSG